MLPGDLMELRSEPANTVWPCPFTPQDWEQTPLAVQTCVHHPARRTDTAPRVCGRVGGSPQTELHDLSPAAVIGLARQEASPTPEGSHTLQSGRETGSSGPSPGAFTRHDRARVAA
jgi:hypothetical protein